jgi:hypothetical protein
MERRRLESWKEIADYIHRSVRTANRWHRERGMPVHYEAGGRTERVFAWADEIDAWRAGGMTGAATAPTQTREPDAGRRVGSGPAVLRRPVVLVPILVAATGLVALLVALAPGPPPLDDVLHYRIHDYTRGGRLEICNSRDQVIKVFESDYLRFSGIIGRVDNHCNVLGLIDFTGDGLQDIVYAEPQAFDARLNRVYLYERTAFDEVELTRSWSPDMTCHFEGQTYGDFRICDMICHDLDGDGTVEIVVGTYSQPFFPGACRVYDLSGNSVLDILHPGRISNLAVFDRDGNGRPEIYVAGIYNYTPEESTPVLFAVEADWTRRGAVLDFFRPGRVLPAAVPPGLRVVYINLRSDKILPGVNHWDAAMLGELSPKLDHPIEVHASAYEGIDPSGKKILLHFRDFHFDRRLALRQAFIPADRATEHEVDLNNPEVQELLRPLYWNGTAWQEEVCFIPVAGGS